MKYTDYAYLFPPRPEQKVARGLLSHYERLGWHAQVKKNGTCTVIFAKGDKVIFKTRHADEQPDGDDHKMWTPKAEHFEFFRGFSDWNVFVAELLHSKTPHIKDDLYIFDQIVKDGVQLVGTTFTERQALLRAHYADLIKANEGDKRRDQLRLHKHVCLAKNFKAGFDKLFDTLQPEDEGLVLKKPDARLEACFRVTSNANWQVKSRIPSKNYNF